MRVPAIGPLGPGGWSDAASKMGRKRNEQHLHRPGSPVSKNAGLSLLVMT
jgi:hypothetical protein